MEHLNCGTKRIEYVVKRNGRKKTIGINIAPDAGVVVSAPRFLDNETIRSFVRKKARWICDKQVYFRRLAALTAPKEFVSGEQFLFLGRKYRLKIKKVLDKPSSEPKLVGRRIFVRVSLDLKAAEQKRTIEAGLSRWYSSKAERIIRTRVGRYSKLMDLTPRKILIRNQKRRWGSCSAKGVLRFNWRIVMAPISIVDYLVVHELGHLKVKNHAPNFWKLVSLVLPNYQERRDWLRNDTGIFRL